MNDDLTQKLLSAEGDLLVALQSGTQKLSSYSQTWSALLDILDAAPETRIVGTETLSLADDVASRISIVSSCFLDIEHDGSFSALQSDYDAIFRHLAAMDLNSDSNSSQSDDRLATRRYSSHSRTLTPETEGSSPAFLASAYQWLLDNLHNPYPTPEVKNHIATSSSSQLSSINSWFTNARRRIGWTTLCRERFSNCKADMLDAAYRALVKEDPQRMLSDEIRHSFVSMKVAAENLYSSTFARSVSASAPVEGSIVGRSVEDGECLQLEQPCPVEALCDSYPSPDQSASASPVPGLDSSLTDESEEEVDVAPPILAGSKRRRSSIGPANQPSFANRPVKRLRASKTCLPSPPTSTDGTDIPSVDGTPEPSPSRFVQPETSVVSPSRKRRLSDSDTSGPPKRLCGSMVASRPHVVADLQSWSNTNTEYSVDDWFNTNFDALFAIPPPIEAPQPDPSALWDVELFKDYSIPENSKHALNRAPPSAGTHVSVPVDLPDLDNLLQSIGEGTFAASSETAQLTDTSGIPYITPLSSSMPDISQASVDWTSLLNSIPVPQPTVCPALPQPIDSQSLPEIDLSMLQLPPPTPAADPRVDLASTYAKLHQLHAMQDAVRRIEQELQSEGVIF